MSTEEPTMIQLRSFIHQRLYSAVEEILGEVEKTITVALHEAEVHRRKEEHHYRRQTASLHRISGAAALGSPLTREEELQETSTQPSIEEESHLSTPEGLVLYHTSADTRNSDDNYCFVQTHLKISKIKEEAEEEYGDYGQMQDMYPSHGGVKSEQDQSETGASYEFQPLSSDDLATQSERSSSDEEWSQSKGARRKMKRRKVKVLRGRRGSRKQKAPAQADSSSQSQMERRSCPICGKNFKCIRPFMKHIKKHRGKNEAIEELLTHLQSALNKRLFCDICGKKFNNPGCLHLHSKIHTGIKDFICQDCGKAFIQKEQLVVHMRTHSGERPFPCYVCGKAFTQKHHLKSHSRTHTGNTVVM